MTAHHIGLEPQHLAGNDGLGRYVFTPGDPQRAEKIAQAFSDRQAIPGKRGFVTWIGRVERHGQSVDVAAIATGMGAGSTEVVLHELFAAGARRIVRVGSSGTGAETIAVGQVVIAYGAVRDEGATLDYAPLEYPAVAHPAAVAAMSEGARRSGLAEHTFLGICHSKATLYAREFGFGPSGQRNLEYDALLRRCGIVASEMEVSTLYVMAATGTGWPLPIACATTPGDRQAVAVLAVIGRDDSQMKLEPELVALGERRSIEVALEGVVAWHQGDTASRAVPGSESGAFERGAVS